jgi:hypothetical protein
MAKQPFLEENLGESPPRRQEPGGLSAATTMKLASHSFQIHLGMVQKCAKLSNPKMDVFI